MSLFDRYGIKEVADVTFYELNEENPGVPGKPVLYLDTLKVSTVEQTAENTEAKGGKGNTALMSWDYGKEITLNLEDALFSMRSMEVMYGGQGELFNVDIDWNLEEDLVLWADPATTDNLPSIFVLDGFTELDLGEEKRRALEVLPVGVSPDGSYAFENKMFQGEFFIMAKNGVKYPLFMPYGQGLDLYPNFATDMELEVARTIYDSSNTDWRLFALPAGEYLIKFVPNDGEITFDKMKWNEDGTFSAEKVDYSSKMEIDISANTFPGTYYVTADTFARNEQTGKDEFFQVVLPKVKLLSESNTITMEAEGDPTVFNMSLKVLKPKEGPMMSLVQYEVSDKAFIDIDYHCINPGGSSFTVLTDLPCDDITIHNMEIFELDTTTGEWLLPDEQGLFERNEGGFWAIDYSNFDINQDTDTYFRIRVYFFCK